MKKLIALVLTLVMICCFSVTALAADSPEAAEKVTVTVRKATTNAGVVDTEYTFEKGMTLTVEADSKYGTFNSWSVYKETSSTSTAMVTLNVAAAASNVVEAVEGVDYEIVEGSLTSNKMTIKMNTSVIVCGNYDNVKTDPMVPSNADDSPSSPSTGDVTALYAVVIMLAVVAFGFGVKKVYSK